MKKWPTIFIYTLILIVAVVMTVCVIWWLENKTYEVVAVFIGLIIVSNCLAKLYAKIFLH